MSVALTLPAVTLPVTANAVSVPTEVILPCAAVLSVPAIPVALTLPAVMLPVVDMGFDPKAAKLAATSALP